MNNKKIVFGLLIFIVISGLITFIIDKYKTNKTDLASNSILINNKSYVINKNSLGRNLINISDNANFSDVLKKFEICQIQAGLPLLVEQVDSALFKIKELSPFPEHSNLDLKIGDVLIGTPFITNKSQIGAVGEIIRLNPDQTTSKIKYTIQAWLSCH